MHNIFKPKYSKKSSRVPLVLWSGGVDSTTLVFHHLKAGRRFDTVSIDGGQHHLKVMREAIARMALWRAFQNADMDETIARTSRELASPEFKADSYPIFNTVGMGGFQQILPWIMGVMRHFDPSKHSHVEMAYVLGDDMAGFIQYIADAFSALGMLQFCEPVQVCFPLMRDRKSGLYKILHARTVAPESDTQPRVSLLDLTWVCELPEASGHCGECPACLKDAAIRHELGISERKFVEMDSDGIQLSYLVPDSGRNHKHRPLRSFDCGMAFNTVYPTREYPYLHSAREIELDNEIIRPGDPDAPVAEPTTTEGEVS